MVGVAVAGGGQGKSGGGSAESADGASVCGTRQRVQRASGFRRGSSAQPEWSVPGFVDAVMLRFVAARFLRAVYILGFSSGVT